MYIHNDRFAKDGTKAEEVFAALLIKDGYKVTMGTFHNQMNHVDLWAEKAGQKFSFDVKSAKRLNRSGEVQHDYIWCELISIRGEKGWAFAPMVMYIAFEGEKEFIVVHRKKLADFLVKTVNLKKIANKAEDALYCKYQRKNRLDSLTLIKREDIEKLAKKRYPKVS